MGQKVHPIGMRLGINRTWKSKWFAKKNYAELLKEDLTIRKYVSTKLARAGISDVVIERKADKVVVNVRTARPGIVIGRKGIEVERLNKELEHLTSRDIRINILEVKKVELDAQLVAEHIAKQLESRMGFRRAVRKAVEPEETAWACPISRKEANFSSNSFTLGPRIHACVLKHSFNSLEISFFKNAYSLSKSTNGILILL